MMDGHIASHGDKGASLAQQLQSRGVSFEVVDGGLRVTAPKGVIDATVAGRIRELKAGILAWLQAPVPASGPALVPVGRDRPLPLGFVQQRMWVHNQLEPDTVLYNLPAAWRLHGPLDRAALERAINAVIARHEVLRLLVQAEGPEPTEVFLPHREVALDLDDLSAEPADHREADLLRRLAELRDCTIDLGRDAPLRLRLFRLATDEHVLFFMPHHVVWDGWSFDIFLRDLNELYRAGLEGRAPQLPALPVQYPDYAVWHRQWLASGALQSQVGYWTSVLADLPEPLDLPADRPRPRLFSHRGDWDEFELSAQTVLRITHLAASHRATSFMVLLAAWYAFLHRVSGQTDIVVGAPVQARHAIEVTDLIGCFVNTLCLRQKLDPVMDFGTLIDRVRDTCLSAYEHQDAPVDLLVDRLVPQRDPSRTPLFQAMFSHQQVSRRPRALGNLTVGQQHVNPAATPTDLMLAVMEGDAGARAVIHYSTDLFDAATIRRLRERFVHLIDAALDDPGLGLHQLPIVTPQERQLMLGEWNATAHAWPGSATALALFEARVAAQPEAVALRCGGDALGYAELARRSDVLAGQLQGRSVRHGGIVGLHLERSFDMVVAILATWKVGAAYLPLDPTFPVDRLKYMIEDSGACLVLSHVDLDAQRPDTEVPVLELESGQAGTNTAGTAVQRCSVPPDARAYVLYTSGSTGRPKGVEIGHRSLANFLNSMALAPGLGAADRLLAVTTLSFDISILELMLPLAVGAQVVIATRDDVLDGYALVDLIEQEGVTAMQATPATWRLLLDSDWAGTSSFKALCGGEALPPALAGELLPRVGELWNMYGPTETTIWSTCIRITQAQDVTVGRPIANTRAYVLDERGALQPPGVPGELCIGGDGVAIGYLGQPELTAQRFVPDPFAAATGARMYRTGDWVRQLADGRIEFQRRRDNQVKVRGFRIELGEIESRLQAHEVVAGAVVVVREDRPGDARIVAYVVPRPGRTSTPSEYRRFLRQSLPDYMLPHLFVDLAQLPLTANGKIDRKALPMPAGMGGAERQRIAPRTDLERSIAELWQEMLGVESVSVTDNFFELGGQSLQAAQLATRIFKQSGHKITPRSVIFETLEQLAAQK